MRKYFSKIKTFLTDRYHLLFKSAADNHLRIQQILKNTDGTYQLTVKFGSYTELKEYQKKLRKITVSLSSAVAMVIVAFVVAPFILNPNRSSAASFLWNQGAWSGAAGSTAATKNGWTGYTSKDININNNAASSSDHAANSLTLTLPLASSTTDTTYAGVDTTTAYPGFFHADPTTGNYSASGTALSLKKVQTSSCTNNAECKTGTCLNSVCCNDACCGTTQIVDTRGAETITYPTVAIGNRCWMKENLRTTKKPDGTDMPLYNGLVPSRCNPAGCASPWGPLYSWLAAMNGAASASAAGYKAQGICPAGWHIPSELDATNDDVGLLLTSAASNGGALKIADSTYWASPNTGATNSTGFSAVGAGYYYLGYNERTNSAWFWTSKANINGTVNPTGGFAFRVLYNSTTISKLQNYADQYYYSVRCVKD